MYHNNRDGDQDPVAILLSAQRSNSTWRIKSILTIAGDPYGSSEQEFAPSLLVIWKLVDGDDKRRSRQKVDVGEASALARLDPRAVQDTFPQPSPRDLEAPPHPLPSSRNNRKHGSLNREDLSAFDGW
jgi:hypothetical protein